MGIKSDVAIVLFKLAYSKAAHCLCMVRQVPPPLGQLRLLTALALIPHLLPGVVAIWILLHLNLLYHFLGVSLRVSSILASVQVPVQRRDTLSYEVWLSLSRWFAGENVWNWKITHWLSTRFLSQLRFTCTFCRLITCITTFWRAAIIALWRSLLRLVQGVIC